MSTTDLLTPVVDGAIRSIKFFNGRLLTGEDLTAEQTANRQARERLGLVDGDGVAFGLDVSINTSASKPTVTVQPGLAVNRCGKTLRLTSPIDVTLVQPAPGTTTTPAAKPKAGGFSVCAPPSTTAYVTNGNVYLLTLAPVQTLDGRTQISNLGTGADACNTKYLVDAVELRLIPLALTTELDSPAFLRNVVAGKVFEDADARAFATDPFGAAEPKKTPLDTLTSGQLTASEVPLATVYWTAASSIVYVDMWSVRRPVAGPAGEWPWGRRLDEHRLARASARLLQFQEQIDDARAAASPPPSSMTAKNVFQYLPPAGVLPINGANGFVTTTFFDGVTIRDPKNPTFVEGPKVEAILRASLGYPPIDLSSGQMIWVYHVFENAYALKGASPPTSEYVVFASGHMPYFGDAHYDVAHWDYSSWT